jgi:hypothetical protein
VAGLGLSDVVQIAQPTYHGVFALTAAGDVYWVNRNEAVGPCGWSGSFPADPGLVHGGDGAFVGPGPLRVDDLPGRACSLGGDYAVLCNGEVYQLGLSYAIFERIEGPMQLGPSVKLEGLSGIRRAVMPTLSMFHYRLSQTLEEQRPDMSVFLGVDGVSRHLRGHPFPIP